MSATSLPRGNDLRRALGAPRSARLEAIVVRLGDTKHALPKSARITREGGLEGDRWALEKRAERQLTLIDVRVVRWLLATRPAQPQGDLFTREPLDVPGDNLVVDWPTGVQSLPAGTRVRIGDVLVETNDVPHLGCKKFEARFGRDALDWVNDRATYDLRLRGIHAVVIEGGGVRVGDALAVR